MLSVVTFLVFPFLLPCLAKQHTVTTRSDGDQDIKKIWVESTMLKSVLRWEPQNRSSEARYTVVSRTISSSRKISTWNNVSFCVNIRNTSCDVSFFAKEAVAKYEFSVSLASSPTFEETVTFRPEFDTKLVPPAFEATRVGKAMFICPETPLNLATKEPISNDMTTLIYQIKYWTKGNETASKVKDIDLSTSEIPLQFGTIDETYCASMRLFEHDYNAQNTTSAASPWSGAACLEPRDEIERKGKSHHSVLALTISSLGGMAVFGLLLFFAHRAWKFQRLVYRVGPIPEALEEIFDAKPDAPEAATPLPEIFDKVETRSWEVEKQRMLSDTSQMDAKKSPLEKNRFQRPAVELKSFLEKKHPGFVIPAVTPGTKLPESITLRGLISEGAWFHHSSVPGQANGFEGSHSALRDGSTNAAKPDILDDGHGSGYVPFDAAFDKGRKAFGCESESPINFRDCSSGGRENEDETFSVTNAEKKVPLSSGSQLAPHRSSPSETDLVSEDKMRSSCGFRTKACLNSSLQLNPAPGIVAYCEGQQENTGTSGVSLPNPAYCSRTNRGVPDILYCAKTTEKSL